VDSVPRQQGRHVITFKSLEVIGGPVPVVGAALQHLGMVVDERHGQLAGDLPRGRGKVRRLPGESVSGRDRAQNHHRPTVQASADDRPQPIAVRLDRQVAQVIRSEHDQGDLRVEPIEPGPDVFVRPSDRPAALVAKLRALPIPPAFRAQASVYDPEGMLHPR